MTRAAAYRAGGFSDFVITLYADDPVAAAGAVATDVLPRLRELG